MGRLLRPAAAASAAGRGTSTLACSPDGTLLAGRCREAVALWDARTGKLRRDFWVPRAATVQPITFSPDGKAVVRGYSRVLVFDGVLSRLVSEIRSRDVRSGEVLWIFEGGREDGHGVTALAFSPDGKLLAASDDEAVVLLDPRTGERKRTLLTTLRR